MKLFFVFCHYYVINYVLCWNFIPTDIVVLYPHLHYFNKYFLCELFTLHYWLIFSSWIWICFRFILASFTYIFLPSLYSPSIWFMYYIHPFSPCNMLYLLLGNSILLVISVLMLVLLKSSIYIVTRGFFLFHIVCPFFYKELSPWSRFSLLISGDPGKRYPTHY